MALQDAETDSFLLFVLFLQRGRKFLITFIRHDGQCIDGKPMLSFTVLVNAQAQSTPDLLAFLNLALGLVQRADLEHIGVVPALPQGGVGENESEFAVKRQ